MSNQAEPAGDIAAAVIGAAVERGLVIAAAESCTAGMAADLLARIPGASKALWGSFVCYTIDAKHRMLGIPLEDLERCGAVSRGTALAMAGHALERSGADLAVSITGLAGPGGDGSAVPVGTVWIGLARRGEEAGAWMYSFGGSRDEVRQAAAVTALRHLLDRLA